MRAPVGQKVEAALREDQERIFECGLCAHRAMVSVGTWGEGAGFAPFGLGADGAGDSARHRARRSAVRRADLLAKIVACPRCRTRDRGTIVKWLAGTWLKLALLGAIPAAAVGLVMMRYGDVMAPMLAAGVWAIFVVVLYAAEIRRTWRAAGRARFVRDLPRTGR